MTEFVNKFLRRNFSTVIRNMINPPSTKWYSFVDLNSSAKRISYHRKKKRKRKKKISRFDQFVVPSILRQVRYLSFWWRVFTALCKRFGRLSTLFLGNLSDSANLIRINDFIKFSSRDSQTQLYRKVTSSPVTETTIKLEVVVREDRIIYDLNIYGETKVKRTFST